MKDNQIWRNFNNLKIKKLIMYYKIGLQIKEKTKQKKLGKRKKLNSRKLKKIKKPK